MIRRALSVVILIAATSFAAMAAETSAGLLSLPEHLEKLKLDKPGSNDWRGTLAMTAKPGCVFYPGEPVNIDIALEGIGNGKLTVEVVSIGLEFAGFGGSAGGDPMITGQLNLIVPRDKAARLEASVEDGLLRLRDLPLWRFGLYAVIVEPPGKGRQPVATV